MILFNVAGFEEEGRRLAAGLGLRVGRADVRRFANDEVYAQIEEPVAGERCLVVGTIAPPDGNLVATLLLCHTLRKEGAAEVTLVFPYLAYARHDKEEPGRSLTLGWIGDLLKASGAARIVTVDIHSRRAEGLILIPVVSLSPARVLGSAIASHGLSGATLVAPDEGAIERCEAVRAASGVAAPVAHFKKVRSASGVTSQLHGSVGERVVVVDDILDTGGTLVAACQGLQAAGAKSIAIFATHGLFTGDRWQELWRLGVDALFVTDTVSSVCERSDGRIQVLAAMPLIEDFLRREFK